MMGLEPTTLGTTNRCSNRLSYTLRFFGDAKLGILSVLGNTLGLFFTKKLKVLPKFLII